MMSANLVEFPIGGQLTWVRQDAGSVLVWPQADVENMHTAPEQCAVCHK